MLKGKAELVRIIKLTHKKYEIEKGRFLDKKNIFLKRNFRLGDISEENKIFKNNILKVYFVAGILHFKKDSKIFQEELRKYLNHSNDENIEIVTFNNIFYVYLEYDKIEKLIFNIKNSLKNDYQQALKNNKNIVIFAHSWGGILAKTAIHRFLGEIKLKISKRKYNKIKNRIVLVTMGTPHTMTYGRTNIAKIVLKTPAELSGIRTLTFGGIFDVVVPAKFSHVKNVTGSDKKSFRDNVSKDLKATHMMFLRSSDIITEIISNTFKEQNKVGLRRVLRDIWRAVLNLFR